MLERQSIQYEAICALEHAAAAARSVDSNQFVLKSLRQRRVNSLDRGPDIEISALPPPAHP
jgi:hypothetical protein